MMVVGMAATGAAVTNVSVQVFVSDPVLVQSSFADTIAAVLSLL